MKPTPTNIETAVWVLNWLHEDLEDDEAQVKDDIKYIIEILRGEEDESI